MENMPSTPSLRILVVDDEPAVIEVLSLFLMDDGHTVETAMDGNEGWQRFQSGSWDIVLTDRIMPGMTGDQLATAIKQAAPQMPVVMVTGVIDSASAVDMKNAGVDAIVRKPFTFTALRIAIGEARARYGLAGQHAA